MKNGKEKCKCACCHVKMRRLEPQMKSIVVRISNSNGSKLRTNMLTRLFAKCTDPRDCARRLRKEAIASAPSERKCDTNRGWSHVSFCDEEDNGNPFKTNGIERSSANVGKSLRYGREDACSTAIHNCIARSIRPPSSPIRRDFEPQYMGKNPRYVALATKFAMQSHYYRRRSNYFHENIRWFRTAHALCTLNTSTDSKRKRIKCPMQCNACVRPQFASPTCNAMVDKETTPKMQSRLKQQTV